MEYRYKSTFTSVAKVVVPTEQDRFLAKASLLPLRGILPATENPDENPDLLYFSCNGAVAGLCNRNGDAVSNATALAIHKSAKNKYVSIDHDREKIVGVVLYPGLSTFGSNEPLTEEAAAALNEPFNMAFAGVLWKVANPLVSKYIANNGGSTDSDALSMSWEISFNSFDIGVGSQNLFDAQIIKADHPDFAAYASLLRVNGGDGKDKSGKNVFRIISDQSVILGYSIVPNPAAHVKGILPIAKEEPPVEVIAAEPSPLDQIPESQRSYLRSQKETGIGFHMCDITMKDGAVHKNVPVINCSYAPNNITAGDIVSLYISSADSTPISTPVEEINVTLANASVNNNTTQNTMKIENIDQLESVWPELVKGEAKASVQFIKDAIEAGSKKYLEEIEAKKNLLQAAEEARAANEEKAKKLEQSLAELRAELDEVKASQEAAEAQTKFSERMAAFDEEFDLDDDDRSLIASDIKSLDDAAFAAYLSKSKKLMCGKSKAGKKPNPFEKKEDKKGEDKEEKKEDKKEDAKASDSIKEAIASVTENAGQATITTGVTVDETLMNSMAAAFGTAVKINGKSIVEKK